MTPLANEILAVLPNLRRYAYALTGHRRWGDRYIEIVLEVLLQEPSRIRRGDDLRFKLYELLHDAMGAVTIGTPGTEEKFDEWHDDAKARRGVLSLTLPDRKMLLLVMVEGFDMAQAAVLTRLSLAQARMALDRAVNTLGDRVEARARLLPAGRMRPELREFAHAH